MKEAALACSGYGALEESLRWVKEVQILQQFGLETLDTNFDQEWRAILLKEMSCAKHDCEAATNHAPTAASRYLKALAKGEVLSVFTAADGAQQGDDLRTLQSCWLNEVRVTGRASGKSNLFGPTVEFSDQFVAEGQIWQDGDQCRQVGNRTVCLAPRHRNIPMTVTETGGPEALSAFAKLLVAGLSSGSQQLSADCTLSSFPKGVMEVVITPVPGPSGDEAPEMTIALKPYLAPATFSCPAPVNREAPFKMVNSLYLLQQIPKIPGSAITVGPDGITHTFDNATEYRNPRRWRYDLIWTSPEGATIELHIRLWAPTQIDIPSTLPTAGLIDVLGENPMSSNP